MNRAFRSRTGEKSRLRISGLTAANIPVLQRSAETDKLPFYKFPFPQAQISFSRKKMNSFSLNAPDSEIPGNRTF